MRAQFLVNLQELRRSRRLLLLFDFFYLLRFSYSKFSCRYTQRITYLFFSLSFGVLDCIPLLFVISNNVCIPHTKVVKPLIERDNTCAKHAPICVVYNFFFPLSLQTEIGRAHV